MFAQGLITIILIILCFIFLWLVFGKKASDDIYIKMTTPESKALTKRRAYLLRQKHTLENKREEIDVEKELNKVNEELYNLAKKEMGGK